MPPRRPARAFGTPSHRRWLLRKRRARSRRQPPRADGLTVGRVKPIKVFREPRDRRRGARTGLGTLLNLGPKSTAWLADVGLNTREELAALGPIETCRRLRSAGHPVNVLMAYALEGALTGTHWNEISPKTKQWLRAEFAQMKRASSRTKH
ncbi:MAG: hypothetical protein C0518_06185 [Opitutus sp.]|nr:hypothetical protein [Opitutus sp.]